MRTRNKICTSVSALFFVLFCVLPAMPLSAQDSLLLNYQGRLSDSGGDPLTGSYNITFKLYSAQTGSLPLWSETHFNVPVSSGLFNVILGSQTALMSTVLDGSNRYLGIAISADPEIAPRTLLTSSPHAAVAGKVLGDIQTGEGSLMIHYDSGDSSIVLKSDEDGASLTLFDPETKALGRQQVRLSSSLANGSAFKLFDSQSALLNKELFEIAASGTLGSSLRMFDTQSEVPGKRFEIMATSGSGASMSFFNQAGEVMGVEPSPFHGGMSIRMFDPQPEPPGKMLEIETILERSKSSALRMYAIPVGGANQEVVDLSASETGTELLMGLGGLKDRSSSYISIKSDQTSSTVEVVGPDGATVASPVTIVSDLTGAKIGIGTSTPSQALHVEGNICYTGTIGACSDAAFKKDIEPLQGALDAVEQLNGVRYSWKIEQFPERHFDTNRQVGLIAQEVKEVLPEAVTLQADGYYTIDYSRLTPLLLEAIKELKQQNDELSKRLEELEKKDH